MITVVWENFRPRHSISLASPEYLHMESSDNETKTYMILLSLVILGSYVSTADVVTVVVLVVGV